MRSLRASREGVRTTRAWLSIERQLREFARFLSAAGSRRPLSTLSMRASPAPVLGALMLVATLRVPP